MASRACGYDEDEEDDRESSQEKPANQNLKQHLLRNIATETLSQHQLHGQAAIVQTELQWFATSIPHSTAYAILEFAGFSQSWVDFFRKYLETPLNMDEAFDGHERVGP